MKIYSDPVPTMYVVKESRTTILPDSGGKDMYTGR